MEFERNELPNLGIKKNLLAAERAYYKNIKQLSEALKNLSEKKELHIAPKTRTVVNKTEPIEIENILTYEALIEKYPTHLLMHVENRLYEENLARTSQINMDIDWYDILHPHGKGELEREKLLLQLEKAHCEAKYFANEAYVAPSSLISVVVNKQMLSRGMHPQKWNHEKYLKIPLCAQEHLICLNEQLGDFFKESGRSAMENNLYPMEELLALKSGKYLHRFANSYQSIYESLDIKDEMPLDKNQLKACTELEVLKKDVRTLEQKALEIRQSIQKIIGGEAKNLTDSPHSCLENKKSPKQELAEFKNILTHFHAKAYVAVHKNAVLQTKPSQDWMDASL
jgi:hypothetical protein